MDKAYVERSVGWSISPWNWLCQSPSTRHSRSSNDLWVAYGLQWILEIFRAYNSEECPTNNGTFPGLSVPAQLWDISKSTTKCMLTTRHQFKALPSHAPLVKTIKVLQDNDLEKVSAFFKKRFTPPPEQSSNIEQFLDEENEELFDLLDELFEVSSSNASSTSTEERKSSRIRLIGKHVLQLSPIFAKLTSTLKLEEESQQQLSSRIVCCTYAHLMRCLSSLYEH